MNDATKTRAALIERARVIVVTGLPGVGKSHLVRQLACEAVAANRAVTLLQWDVARGALATPAMADRYPEVDGVTPPAIRLAIGRWARKTVAEFAGRSASGSDPGARMLVEAPLVGHRLAAVALAADDEHEAHLAGPGCEFALPVPDRALRAHMVSRRADTIAAPSHPREAADAPPHVVTALWKELLEAGTRLGVTGADRAPEDYDPDVYEQVYRTILGSRRLTALHLSLPDDGADNGAGSVYDIPAQVTDCVPAPDEAMAHLAAVESRWSTKEMARVADRWYGA